MKNDQIRDQFLDGSLKYALYCIALLLSIISAGRFMNSCDRMSPQPAADCKGLGNGNIFFLEDGKSVHIRENKITSLESKKNVNEMCLEEIIDELDECGFRVWGDESISELADELIFCREFEEK